MDNGEEVINRYQVRSVYDVLDNSPDDETKTKMENAIAHIKEDTESEFDRGN